MKRLHSKPSAPLLVLALFIIFLAVGAYFLRQPHSQISIVSQQPDVILTSTNTPDEVEPAAAGFTWQGGMDDPKRISLPTINAEGFIQKVGIDRQKQIAVPSNIFMGGWFVDSVRPGNKGLSIIDGHLGGMSKDGIFYKLAALKTGDIVAIEQGNGHVLHYKVKEVLTVPLANALNILFSQDPAIEKQLNLITCGGAYRAESRTYDHRIIAVTEQV